MWAGRAGGIPADDRHLGGTAAPAIDPVEAHPLVAIGLTVVNRRTVGRPPRNQGHPVTATKEDRRARGRLDRRQSQLPAVAVAAGHRVDQVPVVRGHRVAEHRQDVAGDEGSLVPGVEAADPNLVPISPGAFRQVDDPVPVAERLGFELQVARLGEPGLGSGREVDPPQVEVAGDGRTPVDRLPVGAECRIEIEGRLVDDHPLGAGRQVERGNRGLLRVVPDEDQLAPVGRPRRP